MLCSCLPSGSWHARIFQKGFGCQKDWARFRSAHTIACDIAAYLQARGTAPHMYANHSEISRVRAISEKMSSADAELIRMLCAGIVFTATEFARSESLTNAAENDAPAGVLKDAKADSGGKKLAIDLPDWAIFKPLEPSQGHELQVDLDGYGFPSCFSSSVAAKITPRAFVWLP